MSMSHMEFDETLSKVQGTLCSIERLGLLNKQDSVQQVVEFLQNITENASENCKSKIVFFLVLNTNLSLSESLKDDDFVGLFTNVIGSRIEKDYLVIYVYRLNLEHHLFKVIENCHGDIGLELLEVILPQIRPTVISKDLRVEHFYQLWESVFVKITKIRHKVHVNESEKFWDYFRQIYDAILDIIQKLYRATALETLMALNIYYFFRTVLTFVRAEKNPPLADDPMYEMSLRPEPRETPMGEDCLQMVFGSILNCLKSVTMDSWMTWSKCYFEFDQKNSCQFLIGITVHAIMEEGRNYNVPQALSLMAINEKDHMGQATLEEICSKVNSGERKWFHFLARHKQAMENTSINCLLRNIHLAREEDLNAILMASHERLLKGEGSELMRDLFYAAFKKLPEPYEWLEKIFRSYKAKVFLTCRTSSDLVEFFNKISPGNFSLSELLALAIQNPFQTVRNICKIATSSGEQIDLALNLLLSLKLEAVMANGGSRLLQSAVISLMEETTESDGQFFVDFVVSLMQRKLLGITYIDEVCDRLKEYLEEKHPEKGLICLKILYQCSKRLRLQVLPSAILTYLAQVLDHYTWDAEEGFSYAKARGRDLIIPSIELLMKNIGMVPDDTMAWVRQQISKTFEINQAYFCDLWFSRSLNWAGSGKFHSLLLAVIHTRRKKRELWALLLGFGKPKEVRASVVLSLTMVGISLRCQYPSPRPIDTHHHPLFQLLPVLTYRDWYNIYRVLRSVSYGFSPDETDSNYAVLDAFGSAVHVFSLREGKKTLPCREFCQRNYGCLVKNSARRLEAESLVRIFRKIFFLVHAISDEEERRNVWETNSSVVVYLIDLMKRKKVVEGREKEIEELLVLLDLKKVAEAAVEKLKSDQEVIDQKEDSDEASEDEEEHQNKGITETAD